MQGIAQAILEVVNRFAKPGACVKIEQIRREFAATNAKQWPFGSDNRRLGRAVVNGCETLVRRGFLTPHVYTGALPKADGTQPRKPGCYTLTSAARACIDEGHRIASGQPKDGKRPRTVTGGLRLKAWRAMRILTKFSIPDLLKHCADGGEADATSNVGKYVRALCKAGYLAELRREPGIALTSNGYKRWLLVRNSGPDAPVWNQAAKTVTDMNTTTRDVFPISPAALALIEFPAPSASWGRVTHRLIGTLAEAAT